MEYKRIEIDLSQPLVDFKVEFGNLYSSFLIVKYDGDFKYRVNTKTADQLYASELQGFTNEGAFQSLFISCDGAVGQKAVVVVYR